MLCYSFCKHYCGELDVGHIYWSIKDFDCFIVYQSTLCRTVLNCVCSVILLIWVWRNALHFMKFIIQILYSLLLELFQRHCRGWLVKQNFLFQRDAVVKIQCVIRSLKCQKVLDCQKDAALEIQRFIRGHLTRNRLLGF